MCQYHSIEQTCQPPSKLFDMKWLYLLWLYNWLYLLMIMIIFIMDCNSKIQYHLLKKLNHYLISLLKFLLKFSPLSLDIFNRYMLIRMKIRFTDEICLFLNFIAENVICLCKGSTHTWEKKGILLLFGRLFYFCQIGQGSWVLYLILLYSHSFFSMCFISY